MPTNTIRLHRVLRATPEKIYRAFLDPDAVVKWLPPNGFTGKVHHMEAKVGGSYKMSFTNFTTRKSHSFGGKYIELTPNKCIRYNDAFDDPNLPGEIQATITLKKVSCGTGIEHRARRRAGCHPSRGLLPRVARIAYSIGQAGRGRDSRLASGGMRCRSASLLRGARSRWPARLAKRQSRGERRRSVGRSEGEQVGFIADTSPPLRDWQCHLSFK